MQLVTRILLGYAALVMLAGMAVTFSRGGWVAAAAGAAGLLGILIVPRQSPAAGVVLLVMLVGGGAIFTTNYLSQDRQLHAARETMTE